MKGALQRFLKDLLLERGCSDERKGLDSRPLREALGPSKRSHEKLGGPFLFPGLKERKWDDGYKPAFLWLSSVNTIVVLFLN